MPKPIIVKIEQESLMLGGQTLILWPDNTYTIASEQTLIIIEKMTQMFNSTQAITNGE